MAGHRGATVRGGRPGVGGAVRGGQPGQPTQPAIGGAGGAGLATRAARPQLAAAVARQRRRGPTGLAFAVGHRPRQAAAAPDPGAAGAVLRRCDPAQPGLAAGVRPGPAQPGRRDGPHPRWRGVRRAHRAVSGPGRTAKPATGADQHRDHHGRQGRKRRGGAGRRLPRAACRRRAHARHRRPARQQPVVLSGAARARRPRPGRAGRDRNVLRPRATQLRAADRPLPHRLPPGARRAGRLPARTPTGGGLLHPAAAGLPARQAVLGRSGGASPRHRLAAAAPRRRRGVEAAGAHPPEGHQGQRPGHRAAAGRAQRADRGTGLLPRPGRVGRRRPGPLGAVGGPLSGQRQRRLPQEGPPAPQVPHGHPHPRTTAGAADPDRLGGGRTSPHRRAARGRRADPTRRGVHRRQHDPAPDGVEDPDHRTCLGRGPRHRTASRPQLRRTPRFLDLGLGRSTAPHRDSHRRTHRTVTTASSNTGCSPAGS